MRQRSNSRPLGTFENFYFDLHKKHKHKLEYKAKRRRALGTALLICFTIFLLLIKAYQSTPTSTPRITEVSAVKRTPFNFFTKSPKPIKVGIQIGHWKVSEHPEITALHTRTGGEANGVSELEINLAVGNIIKKQLKPYGITVELLPATIPPKYEADLFISLHADSVSNPQRPGYKSAYFEPLRNHPELKTVYLTSNNIKDVSVLGTLQKLQSLTIAHNPIENETAFSLAGATNLIYGPLVGLTPPSSELIPAKD